jgi:hypothetical protein
MSDRPDIKKAAHLYRLAQERELRRRFAEAHGWDATSLQELETWVAAQPKRPIIQDVKARLREQIEFLRRSAEAFDAGKTAEAVRIGSALRVIFHTTRNSSSLLSHLNATGIRIRSKAPPDNPSLLYGWGLATVRMSAVTADFQPIIEPKDTDAMVEASVWWEEKFACMNGVNYTRRSVVLWTVDKDGGAHVDKNVPPDFVQLKADGFVTFFNSQGTEKQKDAHYAFLRTMACEVLHSEELLTLAA